MRQENESPGIIPKASLQLKMIWWHWKGFLNSDFLQVNKTIHLTVEIFLSDKQNLEAIKEKHLDISSR